MLTAEQGATSIGRILTILGASAKDNLPEYVKSVIETCGWMDTYRFDEVCKEIVRTWKAAWRPKPTDFQMTYNRLSKDRNWGAIGVAEKCASCGGTSYVTAWYVRVQENSPPYPVEAVKPCPKCRTGAQQFTKPDLREISREEYDSMRGRKCIQTKFAEELARVVDQAAPVAAGHPMTSTRSRTET